MWFWETVNLPYGVCVYHGRCAHADHCDYQSKRRVRKDDHKH